MAGKQSGGVNIRDSSVNARDDIVGRDKVEIIIKPTEKVSDFSFKIARVTIFVFTLFVGGIFFVQCGMFFGGAGGTLGAVIGGIIGLALAVGFAFVNVSHLSRYKHRYTKSDIVVGRDEVKIIPAPTEEISDFSFKISRIFVFAFTLFVGSILLGDFGVSNGREIVGMLIGEEFRTLGAVIGGIIGLALAVGFAFVNVSYFSRYKNR